MFASQLSGHLVALGHEVIVVCLFEGTAKIPFPGEVIFLHRPLSRRLVDIIGLKLLSRIISTFKPDIVQANAGDTLKYAVLSKFIFKWNAAIAFRNASVVSLYVRSGLVKALNGWLFSKVCHVISVSELSKRDLLSLFPFLEKRITVVPIGIEMGPLPASVDTRKPSNYLLHVGAFTFEKNHEGLMRIMSRVALVYPMLELWLVGDGPLRQRVENQVKQLGLQDKVRFLGFQSTVMSFMNSARALLLPSVIEGLPAVILEAMYRRIPVIAYDVGGISEVVQNEATGWLLMCGDEQGFTAAIEEVLAAPDLETIIENAYSLVVNEFDNRIIAAKFVQVYQQIISGKDGTNCQSKT